jgi:cellulose synthase/poly-beta-1,6-N-acetylglucosamine synthase-like glycosyltransferase
MRSNNNQLAPAGNWSKRRRFATLGGSSAGSNQRSAEGQNASPAFARFTRSLPTEIGFLVHYGIAPGILMAAAATARARGETADAVLLAEGKVSEYHFYRSLARYLRLTFVEGHVTLGAAARFRQSFAAGLVPLTGPAGPAFLTAPRGKAVALLVRALRRNSSSSVALTTPTHLFDLVCAASREEIARKASLGLWSSDPTLCARDGATPGQRHAALAIVALIAVSSLLAPTATGMVCGMLLSLGFLAAIWLRLAACAASFRTPAISPRRIRETELPIYSIVIALYRETQVVPQLLAALEEIDYPRSKLDIKFVVEADDKETVAVLLGARRLPGCEIVVAPLGAPRTKPRALNVALPLVRGQFVTVFDAEDVPDPWQIKMAACRFAAAPQSLGCLQARLAIDNAGDSWLTWLFAIEYAALFDVINVGLGALRVPFPLGGSSNHFRVDVLRSLGGWDAWNVTEDADLGLRLARFGYYAETLPSTTHEEAPAKLADFLHQRRRWCKGWYQTLIVLSRDPRRLIAELGTARCGAALLVLLACALAPLIGPLCGLWLVADLALGRASSPVDILQIWWPTLWESVAVAGIPAILWPALEGMRRRGLLGLWPALFLLPIYSLLVCFAAWMSIYDLVKRPQHWHKTEHGLARSSRRSCGHKAVAQPRSLNVS